MKLEVHELSLLLAAVSLNLGLGRVAGAEKAYQPVWESLTNHAAPRWFDDAKFGVYFHWSAFSVPAFGTEWYSRDMYVKGSRENKHHLATYGPLDKFGYKDFIPMFTAEKFDPEAWAELFEKSGARFAGPVAEHADGFSLWDSRLTKWNAARMGPKRDIVGELAVAIRRHHMKFITTFHHQWLWGWYPTWDPATDCANPAYAGLYGPKVPPSAWKNNPKPDKAFCELWLGKVEEVIDKYQPDLIWFDGRMNIIEESYRREMLAYYYNKAREWRREVTVTYKDKDLQPGAGILDLERGRMAQITPFKWLNDDSIDWKSWCYIQDADIKNTDWLVDELVDIVRKNGNLLLNICPRPDGTIPEAIRESLLGIGRWLVVNGEAIYGTRPWKIYGEGPLRIKEGSFGERKDQIATAADIRFTSKGEILYAICLAVPTGEVRVKSLGKSAGHSDKPVASVSLLGSDEPVSWSQNADALVIQRPQRIPTPQALAFGIGFRE